MTHQNDLTSEEQELLAQATSEDWAEATAELVADPSFWEEIAESFLNGLTGRR